MAALLLFSVAGFVIFMTFAVDDKKMRALEAQRRADEDQYWNEVWEDAPPGSFCISFDGWWREKQALKLPPAKIKSVTPYR
jgi:hypothetical protein